MLIIGLGKAGCNISELFKKHKQYQVELLDEGKGIKKCGSVEEYDSIDYKPRKKAIKSATEGILFVCGSGKISGATLRVLEGLKHVKMTVVYIGPDLEQCSNLESKRHKVHFGILQQYARCGSIEELLVLDNKIIAGFVGYGTVLKYYDNVNHYIYSMIHTLNYCNNVKPDFDTRHEIKDISKISTLGWGIFGEKEEKTFFSLDNITETSYIININEDELNNDVTVMPTVQAMVKDNKALNRETSFGIWSTKEEKSYFYIKHCTHIIQGEE